MKKDPVVRMDDLYPWRPPERSDALAHYPARDKVMPLADAIGRHVSRGATVALGTCLEQMIPFAAAHELIRAGLAGRVAAAWVGNVMMGSAYCFRRAAEQGKPRALEVVEFSNFTLAQ